MSNSIPLFVIGLPKDEPVSGLLMSKFGHALEKAKKILPKIVEAKISVEYQHPEGSRRHYDVTSILISTKNRLVYTESGWDILKIADELCRKLEGELPKHVYNRQKESIRKRVAN